MSGTEYRRLAASVDGELARARDLVRGGEDEIIICTDGPGYRTERVRRAELSALYGFCPLTWKVRHPNVSIVCAVQKVIEARLPAEDVSLASGERCSRRGV